MADIERIDVRVVTGDGSGAGTDGRVYAGIAGREFRIDSDSDDFERGSDRTYVLGEGPSIRHEDRNDPRNPRLVTTDLDLFPVYLRFEPQGDNANWDLERVDITVNPGPREIKYSALKDSPHLWLGQDYGKYRFLKKTSQAHCGIYFLDTFSNHQLGDSVGDSVGDRVGDGYWFFNEGGPRDTDTYSLTDGWLKIRAGIGQDLWGGTPPKRGAPIMLYKAPAGNYTLETFVTADQIGTPSQPPNTQMGLFALQDINNWIFFGLTNHDFTVEGSISQGDGLIVTLTEDNHSRVVELMPFEPDLAYLRIEKSGSRWEFSWKEEAGDSWSPLTSFETIRTYTNEEVGMGVKTFDIPFGESRNPCTANFDYFLIEEKG